MKTWLGVLIVVLSEIGMAGLGYAIAADRHKWDYDDGWGEGYDEGFASGHAIGVENGCAHAGKPCTVLRHCDPSDPHNQTRCEQPSASEAGGKQ